MKQLSLVGIGIGDEKGISLEGLEELKACEKIFAETYTNSLPKGTIRRLEALLGKKIELLGRKQVEEEKKILSSASRQKTALVVSGDPMIATTHVSLVLSAKKLGIQVKLIHAASIISAAISESGLQAYKFGKTVTLAYWGKNYKPMAAYDIIAQNLERGLHTLLLLDIDEKSGPMKPNEAAKLLLEMEKTGKKKILSSKTKVIVLSSLCRPSGEKSYLSLGEFASKSHLGVPSVLLVPGKLHFVEEDMVRTLY